MRMITGALLLLVAEQAFFHAHSIGFPHYRFVNEILLPVSGLLAISGVVLIGTGLWFDPAKTIKTGSGDDQPSSSRS